MVNFKQVRELDLAAIETFEGSWHRISAALKDAKREFDERVSGPLGKENWKGKAGDAAKKRVTELAREIDAVAEQASSLRSYLDKIVAGNDETDSLRDLKTKANELAGTASAKGMEVSDDGELSWDEDPSGDKENQAKQLSKDIADVVRKATEADEFIANSLRVIFGTTDNFDSQSRIYGSDADERTSTDWFTKKKLEGVEMMMRKHYGWTEASDLLQHWLEGSGKPYQVDANKMLGDMPQFQKDVDEQLGKIKKQPDGTFSTEWADSAPNLKDGGGDKNLNWYYALNHFEYRLVGEKQDGQINYHVEVRKEYDWGTPGEHRANLEKGPIKLEQADIAHLHSAGMARDFHVQGQTGQKTVPAK